MIPLWLKVIYTVFVVITILVYLKKYGPGNFLWFSDIALIVTVAALWLENQLLASMMAVGILLPEAVWNVSFFGRLLTGKQLTGLAGYMFDPDKPLYLRAISLFHVFLPVLLVWLVSKLGYTSNAWIFQTMLAWVVLPLTYCVTKPEDNINWVYGPKGKPQKRMPPLLYLILVMLAFPILVYLPTHLILNSIFNV